MARPVTPPFGADVLRSLLSYDPETGAFTWICPQKNQHRKAGAGAGYFCPSAGYIRIKIMDRAYLAHRVAWCWMTGAWPVHTIDHMDGDRLNNRFANLRDVPHAINCQNERRVRDSSTNDYAGVVRDGSRWAARIRTGGRLRHIGMFGTQLEAHEAYLAKKRELHPGFLL